MKHSFISYTSNRRVGTRLDTLKGLLGLAWLVVTLGVFPGLVQAAEIEEIIVTAQKRERNVNDVSLSVTVFSGDMLRELGINQPIDIVNRTPGLTVANQFGDTNSNFSIRGVGQSDFPENNNPAVSVYIDEVFMASPGMVGFQVFDMERVEVLKGPQGTLYGRNTTGGAINFISHKPTQGEESNGFIRADYSKYDTFEIEAAVGGAITDELAGRVAFLTKQRTDGYQTNRFDGSTHGEVDRTAFRVFLDWAPRQDLSVLFKIHAGQEDSDNQYYDAHGFADPVTFGPCATRLEPNPNGCVDFFGTTEPDGNPFDVSVNPTFGSFIDSTMHGAALTIDWDLPRVSLTSITGYDRMRREVTDDFDATPFIQVDDSYRFNIWAVSEELRLTSDESWPINWILGAYYSTDFIRGLYSSVFTDFGFGPFDVNWKQKTRSAALFGHFEWPFAENWQLIGGIRYTDEKKKFAGGTGSLGFQITFTNETINDSDVSGEIGLEFRPNDDWLIYGKWSRGFKSGGFDGSFTFLNSELIPVRPEENLALEGGFKATLLNGAIQLNTAAYYYQWNDLQAQVPNTFGGIPQVSLGNAGDAEMIGVETELQWSPVENLFMSVGLNYFAKAEVVESIEPTFVNNDVFNSPDITFNGLVRYNHPLQLMQHESTAYVQTDFSYKDDVFWEASNLAHVRADDYWLLNLRAGIKTLNDQVEVAGWIRNLTDKEHRIGGFPGQDFTHDIFFYGLPRTYGISFTYRYD